MVCCNIALKGWRTDLMTVTQGAYSAYRTPTVYNRTIYYISDNTLQVFGAGYQRTKAGTQSSSGDNNAIVNNNDFCIPYKIFGLI